MNAHKNVRRNDVERRKEGDKSQGVKEI